MAPFRPLCTVTVTVALGAVAALTGSLAIPIVANFDGVAVAAAAPGQDSAIGTAASASVTADRVSSPAQPSACQRIARAAAMAHSGTTTQVVVTSVGWTDTTAKLQLAVLTPAGWLCDPAMEARLGFAGFRPLEQRRSGDGATPAGAFALATMTAPDGQRFSFFGNAADPGVHGGGYRRVETGDCFGATPNTPGYGHLRNDASCTSPDEYLMRFTTTYSNAALIGANAEPNVSGDAADEIPFAAAIFLHRNTYVNASSGATKTTSGCVSLAQRDLSQLLVALDSTTVFVMGPEAWLLETM